MRKILILLFLFQFLFAFGQQFKHLIPIPHIGIIKVFIKNTSNSNFIFVDNGNRISIEPEGDHETIIEKTEEIYNLEFALRLNQRLTIEYYVLNVDNFEFKEKITYEYPIPDAFAYAVDLDDRKSYTQMESSEVDPMDYSKLFLIPGNKPNTFSPKLGKWTYIESKFVNDTLKRTLASVQEYMTVNFYEHYLEFTEDNKISHSMEIKYLDENSTGSFESSCCFYEDSTIFIFNYAKNKYKEFPYLHEVTHFFGIEGDLSKTVNSDFIILDNEIVENKEKIVNIRNNEDLYVDKFKLDITTLLFMLGY